MSLFGPINREIDHNSEQMTVAIAVSVTLATGVYICPSSVMTSCQRVSQSDAIFSCSSSSSQSSLPAQAPPPRAEPPAEQEVPLAPPT